VLSSAIIGPIFICQVFLSGFQYLFFAIQLQQLHKSCNITGLMQLQEMNNSLTMAGVEKYLANASK